jgi:hypothetical protein
MFEVRQYISPCIVQLLLSRLESQITPEGPHKIKTNTNQLLQINKLQKSSKILPSIKYQPFQNLPNI